MNADVSKMERPAGVDKDKSVTKPTVITHLSDHFARLDVVA